MQQPTYERKEAGRHLDLLLTLLHTEAQLSLAVLKAGNLVGGRHQAALQPPPLQSQHIMLHHALLLCL